MIDDLWHGYDVSSTLTSNFSPSISIFSRRGDPRWNMVSGNLRFQGVHLHSVPLCHPRIFALTFISCAATGCEGNRRAENITVRDRYLVSSVRDVIRVSLPSMASDRVPRRIEREIR